MTDHFAFETATKDQAKARIALAGPAGSGKTWTALTLATRFAHPGGRIAVIDTERGSASKYAGEFAFDRLNLTTYDPRLLPKALAAAAQQGYAVVVIDSLSRFWSGTDGMLEQVDNAGKRGYGGNSFGGWKEARPMENAMVEAMLGYPGHVIVTMRTKTAWEIGTDDRGRKVPVKIGLKPEQREGIEYEFDIIGDMDMENTMVVSKSRCPALSGAVVRRPDAEVAATILAWLGEGRPVLDATAYRDMALSGSDPVALRDLWSEVRQRGLSGAVVVDEHGDTVTLGDFIARKGKEALPVRTGDDLPRNADGSVSRSRTTDAEKDAAGVMTDAQQKEHTALGGGNGKTPRAERGKVQRVIRSVAGQGEIPPDPWLTDGTVLAEPEHRPGSIAGNRALLGRVQALFSRWFAEDEREQRLQAAEQVLGRQLTGPHLERSFSNMALSEAHKLMDTLADVKTRDDLIARLAKGVAS